MLPKFIDGDAAYSSGQRRLNNIDRNHLVLVSGKPVLQNSPLNADGTNQDQ